MGKGTAGIRTTCERMGGSGGSRCVVLGWMHEDPNDVRKMTALGTGGGTEVCVSMDAWMSARRGGSVHGWTRVGGRTHLWMRRCSCGYERQGRTRGSVGGGVGTGTAGRGAGRVRASGRQVPAWERALVHGGSVPRCTEGARQRPMATGWTGAWMSGAPLVPGCWCLAHVTPVAAT